MLEKTVMARRRSPGLFGCSNLLLLLICMSIHTEMVSAGKWWRNICTPGDAYIERNYNPRNDCNDCPNWCRNQCSSMKSSVVRNECRSGLYRNWVACQCCCKKPPSSPPSPPLPPTPLPSPFTENGLSPVKICTAQQQYLELRHSKGTDCGLKPRCQVECKKNGRFNAGNQCLGSCRLGCKTNDYTWIEQCCCGNTIPSPPPPSPSPPPPSPPPPSPPPPSPPPPPPSPPPPSPPPPSPSPPPPSPPPPPPPSPPPPPPSPPPPSLSPPPPSPPPPPPPSPPPPSPPPPSPSPPPPPSAAINICAPGDAFTETSMTTTDCTRCTSYCRSKCLETGSSLRKTGCREDSPSTVSCKCCCRSISSLLSVLGPLLFAEEL